jgi:lipopolysaccharide transport system ATP-binding protein
MAAIEVEGLGKRYRVWTQSRPTNLKERVRSALTRTERRGDRPWQDIWALRDVTFDVEPGEVLGVIGPNGAGKSTLLTILAQITEPTLGEARIRGRVSSLLEVGTGFHPELSGRDNVFLNGAILGMSRAETTRKYDQIVEFSGVRDFIDIPVKRYSTGMYVRLAFAVAAHLDPEVLLLDEVLAVGDQAFQQQCLARIQEMTRSGRTVLFVSHDVNSVARLCRRGLVIRGGGVDFLGDVDGAIEHYLGTREVMTSGGDLNSVEREGNGKVRFRSVAVRRPDGDAVVADQPMEIALSLAVPAPIASEHVQAHVRIRSATAGDLITLSTRFDPDTGFPSGTIEDGTTIVCRVDELPLRAGHYFLSFSLDRLGELYDSVADQLEFTVHPSDFFGAGVLPSDHDGPVLVRHAWRAEHHVAGAAPSGGG